MPPKLAAWEAGGRRAYDLGSGEGVVGPECSAISLQDMPVTALPGWLVDAMAAGALPALRRLDLRFCRQLRALPDMSGATALSSVVVIGCTALVAMPDPAAGIWTTFEWKDKVDHLPRAERGRVGVPKRLAEWSDCRFRAVLAAHPDEEDEEELYES